jgi:hypothetical protein
MKNFYLIPCLFTTILLLVALRADVFSTPIPKPIEPSLAINLKIREPKDRIELLSRRLEMNLRKNPGSTVRIPLSDGDNPLIFREVFGFILLDNTGPCDCEVFHILGRPYTIRLDPNKFWEPDLPGGFRAHIRTWNTQGNEMNMPEWYIKNIGITAPDPAILAVMLPESEKWPTVCLKRGERCEVPCRLFTGEVTEPGTYTIQAIVSYLESPTKKLREFETEKIKVEITKTHIEEAKIFYSK